MATVPVPDVAEVEIRQMIFGQLIENTLYFALTGGWDEAALMDLATSVGVWFIEEVLPLLSNELTFREAVARDLSAGATAQQIYSIPPVAGGNANLAAPSNVAAAISLRTATAGRSFRGRNYVAGLPLDAVVENEIESSVGDALVAAYNAMMTTYVTPAVPGARWSVVSRFTGGAARAFGLATEITVATLTDYFIDSQRKRLTGRGR